MISRQNRLEAKPDFLYGVRKPMAVLKWSYPQVGFVVGKNPNE